MKTILHQVTELLEDIDPVSIRIDEATHINLISELKVIPRSGKSIRIDNHGLALPKQSLYDHVLQVAFYADILLDYFCFTPIDRRVLVNVITFHDIAEPITGDIPTFTREWRRFKKQTGNRYQQERSAYELITDQLPSFLKLRMGQALELLAPSSARNLTAQFFQFLDKSEPIISVWRYLFWYRSHLSTHAFITAMDDFFAYKAIRAYAFDSRLTNLVDFLQDRNKAYAYSLSEYDLSQTEFPYLKYIIEGRPMLFIDKPIY